MYSLVDGSEYLKFLFGLQWSLLLPCILKCLLVILILLVIRLENVIDGGVFFLIAICFRFSSKTLAFPTFFCLSLPTLPQCLCCLPERGTPPFNLTSVSTQQAPQSFSWLLVSHLIRHHAFMLAPCICTRYFVKLSGRTESFQLAYLLVCQIGERGGEKGSG